MNVSSISITIKLNWYSIQTYIRMLLNEGFIDIWMPWIFTYMIFIKKWLIQLLVQLNFPLMMNYMNFETWTRNLLNKGGTFFYVSICVCVVCLKNRKIKRGIAKERDGLIWVYFLSHVLLLVQDYIHNNKDSQLPNIKIVNGQRPKQSS